MCTEISLGALLVVVASTYVLLKQHRRCSLHSCFSCIPTLVLLILLSCSTAVMLYRLLALTSNTSTASKFFNGFRVGGHRGSPRLAPENTIESFAKAKAARVDLVEFDLSLTKDSVVVLMHDDDLLRTCGEPGLLSSLTLKQLKEKNAGYTFNAQRRQRSLRNVSQDEAMIHRIPTLTEVVNFCCEKNMKMLFDVKDGSQEMVNQILSTISNNDLYEKVIVSSFFPWVSYAVKKADPKILTGITWRPYFFSYNDIGNRIPRFTGLKHFAAMLLDIINVKLLETYLPQFLGVEMILTNEMDINRRMIDHMSSKNIQVVAWTVNDAQQMLYYVHVLKIPILTDVPHVYDQLRNMHLKFTSSD